MNTINEEGSVPMQVGGIGGGSEGYSGPVGGVGTVNKGNISGMGIIKSPTVSSVPGDVAGSVAGSGDIGMSLGSKTKTKTNCVCGGNCKCKKSKQKSGINVSDMPSIKKFTDIK